MNNVSLIGNITAEPEIKWTSGKDSMCVAHVTLAVNNPFKKDDVAFIRCVAFNKTAELLEEYFHKGDELAVTGQIKTGQYEHEKGYTVYTTEVAINQLTFTHGRASDTQEDNTKNNKGGKSNKGNANSRR